jgi:hypothetical protein
MAMACRKKRSRLGQVLAGVSVQPRHSALIDAPGIEVTRLHGRAFAFGAAQFGLDRADDGVGDLVLQREDIRQRAVVAARPDVVAGGAVDRAAR